MEKNINIKQISIYVAIAVFAIIITILAKLGINKLIISNQMKTATHAITIRENVKMYSSAKEKGKSKNIEIGSNVYILETISDKSGNSWHKVKTENKVRIYISRKYRHI